MERQRQLIISRKAFNEIVAFEVSSPAYYDKCLRHPVFPGLTSGITIGIGYDLGYHSCAEIKSDWGKYLEEATIKKLCGAAGFRGQQAKDVLTMFKGISIPYESAETVFMLKSLPKYAELTWRIYPGVEELLPDACGAVLSLVYNRGGGLLDRQGDSRQSRKEMRMLLPLIEMKDYTGIAKKIREMKRLWDGIGEPRAAGLLIRRDREADLVENAVHQYGNDDTITINF